jgi:acyl-CoA thioester hydrolase
MARIKLKQQETYEFSCPIDVQPRDINYGGHLANDTLISLVGAARALMFHAMGLSELDLGDGRTGVVMSDLVVNYKSEAFLFDRLLVETRVDEFTHTGFRLFHRVTKGEELVALVETGLAAFSYTSGRVVPVPAPFVKAVADRKAQKRTP